MSATRSPPSSASVLITSSGLACSSRSGSFGPPYARAFNPAHRSCSRSRRLIGQGVASARVLAHAAARGDLDAAILVGGRVLDERDDAAGHEARGTYRRAAAGHLADLDDAAGSRHLEPPTRPGRRDLERLNALPGIDDGLDTIA